MAHRRSPRRRPATCAGAAPGLGSVKQSGRDVPGGRGVRQIRRIESRRRCLVRSRAGAGASPVDSPFQRGNGRRSLRLLAAAQSAGRYRRRQGKRRCRELRPGTSSRRSNLRNPVLPAAMQQIGESDHELHVRIVALEAAATLECLGCFVVPARAHEAPNHDRYARCRDSGAIASARSSAVTASAGRLRLIKIAPRQACPSARSGLSASARFDARHRLSQTATIRRAVRPCNCQAAKPIRIGLRSPARS